MIYPIISLVGFVAYLRAPVKIPTLILPDDDWSIPFAYTIARETVHPGICNVSPVMYQQAVYNLATDIVINVAQDQPDRDELQKKRKEYKIDGFIPGVIQSSSNAGTAESLLNPEVF